MEIPHNIIVSDEGESMYIIPRQFSKKEQQINSCWNDIAGLVSVRDEILHKSLTNDEVNSFLKTEVCLNDEKFEEVYEKILTKFDSIYLISKE